MGEKLLCSKQKNNKNNVDQQKCPTPLIKDASTAYWASLRLFFDIIQTSLTPLVSHTHELHIHYLQKTLLQAFRITVSFSSTMQNLALPLPDANTKECPTLMFTATLL